MSNTTGDISDKAPQIPAWNRTPGKPNLSSISGNLPNTASWGGKKKQNSNVACSDVTQGDVWPRLTGSALSRKNEPPQWPTPAEIAGGARNDSINDFSIPNSWNAPGTSLALRSLAEADDRSDAWPPLDAVQSIDSVSIARTIAGSSTSGAPGSLISNESAFTSRQRVHSMTTGGKPRNESLSSWGSPSEGDLNAFSSTQSTSTTQQQRPEGACSNVSDAGNHPLNGQMEAHLINSIVNSRECWGQRPIDQSTPWDVSQLNKELAATLALAAAATAPQGSSAGTSTGLLSDDVSMTIKQRRAAAVRGGPSSATGGSLETSVWTSEPPTGTGIWEMSCDNSASSSRWKTSGVGAAPTASSSRLGPVNSPSGGHRVVQPSSTFGAVSQQQQQQVRGGFSNSFFPSQSGPQQQQQQSVQSPRFPGASAAPGSGRGGVMVPNGILGPAGAGGGGGAFKSQTQGASGWPLSLTPDGQSPLEDNKLFLGGSGGPWSKQGPLGGGDLAPRWPSPLGVSDGGNGGGGGGLPTPPPQQQQVPLSQPGLPQQQSWQTGVKFSPTTLWSASSLSSSTQQQQQAAPQRFHLLRQGNNNNIGSTSNPLRFQQAAASFHSQHGQAPFGGGQASLAASLANLRTDVARQLMVLGFHDDVGVLLSENFGFDELEKFLFDLRDRTSGMHPGLNQLVNTVSALLATAGVGDMSQPGALPLAPQQQQHLPFDLFDNRGVGGGPFHMGGGGGKQGSLAQQQQHFGARQGNLGPHSEALAHLFCRENNLQLTIVQLDKKKRELSMKQSQLRKMNSASGGATGPGSSSSATAAAVRQCSNSLLQEILTQQAHITQQIEAQEAQLAQVRFQIALLSRAAAGGEDPASAMATAAMLMRLRGVGGGGNRMTTGFGGPRGGGGGGGGGPMMMNSGSPTADMLAPRLADLKLSMGGGEVPRRTPWDTGSSVWDTASSPQQPFGGSFLNDPSSSSNVFPLPPSSSAGAANRWGGGANPSAAAAAAANAIWNASWLLLTDLGSQFSLDLLRLTITSALEQRQQQSGGGGGGDSSGFEIHSNLAARYVLVGFCSATDAALVSNLVAEANLAAVSMISPAEALSKLHEIKSLEECAASLGSPAEGGGGGGSSVWPNPQQQQQQQATAAATSEQ